MKIRFENENERKALVDVLLSLGVRNSMEIYLQDTDV